MGVYRLVALSDLAKGFTDGGRGPDLALWSHKPVLLGRAVASRSDGFKLPPDWAQISGKHCTISATGEGDDMVWSVKDSSTNGTFINGSVVGKGNTAVLKPGDRLSLSYLGSGHKGPAALAQEGLEWQLVYDPDGTPPPPASSAAAGTKRRQVSTEPPDSNPQKRGKAEGDHQELLQLRQSNQELRKQNEQYRQDLEQQDQRAQKEQEAALARKQEQHEEELKQLQAQAEQRATQLQEEHQATLHQLQEQMGATTEQLEQAQQELSAAKAALEAEQSKTAELTTRLAAAEERQQQLQQELASNTEHLQQQLAAAQSAQAAAADATSALAAVREAAAAAQQEAVAAKAALVEAQTQAAAAVHKKVAAEEAALQGDRQLQAARRQLTALQEQLGGKKEHLLLQHKQFAQMQFSLAALTAEQQERSARMHQLMEQLQTLAGDRDRAAAELLGAISEQVTALQQSTAEELQEVGGAGAAEVAPDASAGGGSQREGPQEGAADMMMTQLASSEVMPGASGLAGAFMKSPAGSVGAAAGSGATAVCRDGAGGMDDVQMDTEGEEDAEAAGAGMPGGGSEVDPAGSGPANSAAAGGSSQQFPAATLQLLTGRQLTGTYGASLDWQPLTVPLLGQASLAPNSGAAGSSHPPAAGGPPGMADLSPAAGPAGQAAVAEGAAAAATAKVGMEVAGDEDMEDPLEVHGATDEALAAAAVQAPAAAGLAGTVIHGTESDELGPTTQDSARLAAQGQHGAVADAAALQEAPLQEAGGAAGGNAAGAGAIEQQQQQEEEEEEEEMASQQEAAGEGAAAGMLPEAAQGVGEVDRGSQEGNPPAAAVQQGLGSQEEPDDDESTEGGADDEGEEQEEEQQEEDGEEELRGEVRQEEGLLAHEQSGGGGAAASTPSQRQPLGPVSQQLQDVGGGAEGLKAGWPGHPALATPPGQMGGSENVGR